MALPCRKLKSQFGYALKRLYWKHIEGEAQNQLSLAHGRAEPCLTTAGKAESSDTLRLIL